MVWTLLSHTQDKDGNWHVGAITTLIDIVGAAAIFSSTGQLKASVDFNISYYSTAKIQVNFLIFNSVIFLSLKTFYPFMGVLNYSTKLGFWVDIITNSGLGSWKLIFQENPFPALIGNFPEHLGKYWKSFYHLQKLQKYMGMHFLGSLSVTITARSFLSNKFIDDSFSYLSDDINGRKK